MSPASKHSLDPQRTLAILIGIADYDDFQNVDPAPNNVRELAKLLQDPSIIGIPPERIHSITKGNSKAIKKQLIQLTENQKKDGINTLIFYFAGHGFRRTDESFYLAAKDSDKTLMQTDGSTGIAFKTVQQIIRQSRIPQTIFLLDACYSGSATLSDQSSLEEIQMKGSYTIASSDAKEVSYFDADHQHTLFSGELLEILKNGLPIQTDKINLEQLYAALVKTVKSRNPKMSPQQKGSQEITGSNFLFFNNRQYDNDAIQVKEFEAELKTEIAKIKKGDIKEAKRALKGLKTEVLEELEESKMRKALLAKIEEEIAFCLKYPKYRSYIQPVVRHEYEGKIAELRRQLSTLQGDPESAVKKLKKGIVEQLRVIDEQQSKLEESESALIQSKKEIELKDQRLSELETRLKELETEIKSLKGDQKKNRSQGMVEKVSGVPFEMIQVQGGSFKFGDQKEVSLPSFQIGKYPVTQGQWRKVMGSFPEKLGFKGCDNCPVEGVSWNDIQSFLLALNAQTGKNYRLPSESEWEYAARGGEGSKGFTYAGGNSPNKLGWYGGNSNEKTHPVGELIPNEMGLHDMSGNVWEWCQDHWHGTLDAPTDGSAWEDEEGCDRVIRGGSWNNDAQYCSITSRYDWHPNNCDNDIGFRLAHSL